MAEPQFKDLVAGLTEKVRTLFGVAEDGEQKTFGPTRWIPGTPGVAGFSENGVVTFNPDNYPRFGAMFEGLTGIVNCTNYAYNEWQLEFPLQPGMIGVANDAANIEDFLEWMNPATPYERYRMLTRELVISDGLIPARTGEWTKPHHHLVRLSFAKRGSLYQTRGLPGTRDRHVYHWQRLDDDGLWSEKITDRRPSRLGRPFMRATNPEGVNKNYPDAGGYWLVPNRIAPITPDDINWIMSKIFDKERDSLRQEIRAIRERSVRAPGQPGATPR